VSVKPTIRYKGQPLPIVVAFPGNPLLVYGETGYSNVVEITMNLKQDLANDADDLYLEKSSLVGDGVVLDQGANSFAMILEPADYANVLPGTYQLTLNVKVTGQPDFYELQMVSRTIVVTADTNRA